MTREFLCSHVLASPAQPAETARSVRLEGNRIASVEAASGPTQPVAGDAALLQRTRPCPHGALEFLDGASGRPLETWLFYLALPPPVDPYLAAAVSLSRSALGGSGAVMVHYTRIQGLTDYVTEARAVAGAATDVGVRIGFAVGDPRSQSAGLRSLGADPCGAAAGCAGRDRTRFMRAPLPFKEQVALVDAVAEAVHGPMVDVQYGPNGVQWATRGLLEAVAEASARTGRRVHMHLLETRYQRDWADREYPNGVVKFLDEIGLLSPA